MADNARTVDDGGRWFTDLAPSAIRGPDMIALVIPGPLMRGAGRMADRGKRWVYRPPTERASPGPAALKPSAALKAEVEARAQEFVASVLKPRHVQPPPENTRLNYIVDIATKW